MRSLITFLACSLALVPMAARADGNAEVLKQEGIKAAKDKDWATARDKFQASYALDPRPLTLFNLAAAQEQTELLIEARDSYRKFLDVTLPGDANDKFRRLAKSKLATIDSEIPTLRITLTGFTASVVVEIDGRALAPAELLAPVSVNPGDHVVLASRGAEQLAKQRVTLARGARETTELVGPPPKVVDPPVATGSLLPPLPPPPPPSRHEPGGLLSSGWFWLAASVVVLSGAGAGYYYVLRDPSVVDPTAGTLGTIMVR